MVIAAAAAATAVSAAAGVAGSAMQGAAARKAANDSAYQQELNRQQLQKQYETTRADLRPFVESGYAQEPAWANYYKDTATPIFQQIDADLATHVPGKMDQATLEQTPGYQFALAQGQKALQNSAAARGLGVSGSAMNAASNYATGLANTTYKDQFNQLQTQYEDYLKGAMLKNDQVNDVYKMMGGPVAIGERAAEATGTAGTANANAQSGSFGAEAQGNAAADIAQGNAFASGINAIGNAPQQYLGMSNFLQNQNLLGDYLKSKTQGSGAGNTVGIAQFANSGS